MLNSVAHKPRTVADLLSDPKGAIVVLQRRVILPSGMIYSRNIIERGAFALFVADLLADRKGALEVLQC